MVNNEPERFWGPDDGQRGGSLSYILILSNGEACDLKIVHFAFVFNLGSNAKFLRSSKVWELVQIEILYLLRGNLLHTEHKPTH